jgi:hypothetical protein
MTNSNGFRGYTTTGTSAPKPETFLETLQSIKKQFKKSEPSQTSTIKDDSASMMSAADTLVPEKPHAKEKEGQEL